MAVKVAAASADGHRVIPEMRPEMARASLRKPESVDLQAEIGRCLDFARRMNGWNLEQLASALPPPQGADQRDPRQVQRWMEGKERTQLDVVFAVAALRGPFVIALAHLAECDVFTTISMRRTA